MIRYTKLQKNKHKSTAFEGQVDYLKVFRLLRRYLPQQKRPPDLRWGCKKNKTKIKPSTYSIEAFSTSHLITPACGLFFLPFFLDDAPYNSSSSGVMCYVMSAGVLCCGWRVTVGGLRHGWWVPFRLAGYVTLGRLYDAWRVTIGGLRYACRIMLQLAGYVALGGLCYA